MNIAEILKYCPKGTKLYCILCGNTESNFFFKSSYSCIIYIKCADLHPS